MKMTKEEKIIHIFDNGLLKTTKELSEELGVKPATIGSWFHRLRQCGVSVRVKSGKTRIDWDGLTSKLKGRKQK